MEKTTIHIDVVEYNFAFPQRYPHTGVLQYQQGHPLPTNFGHVHSQNTYPIERATYSFTQVTENWHSSLSNAPNASYLLGYTNFEEETYEGL